MQAGAVPSLQESLNAALPQTQCTRCGFEDCAAYAKALAQGEADINQCPPGGAEGVRRLAALTGRPIKALNPEHGQESVRKLALIDENWCIGCTLCLQACPTDAIVGSNKHMHTVLPNWCTGCELCLPVCPVDCIEMRACGPATGWAAWSVGQAQEAAQRYALHRQRLARESQDTQDRLNRHTPTTATAAPLPADGAQVPVNPLQANLQALLVRAQRAREARRKA